MMAEMSSYFDGCEPASVLVIGLCSIEIHCELLPRLISYAHRIGMKPLSCSKSILIRISLRQSCNNELAEQQ